MLIFSVAPTRLFISCQIGLASGPGGTVPSVWVTMLISPPRAGGSATERMSCAGYFVWPAGAVVGDALGAGVPQAASRLAPMAPVTVRPAKRASSARRLSCGGVGISAVYVGRYRSSAGPDPGPR